jgi:hypothetical protein
MDTTPNTVNFMIIGFVVIYGVMAVYLGSLVVRFRSLRQDEKTLDELEKDQK